MCSVVKNSKVGQMRTFKAVVKKGIVFEKYNSTEEKLNPLYWENVEDVLKEYQKLYSTHIS